MFFDTIRIPNKSNENELELLNETLNFTMTNITKTLTNEIVHLKNVIYEDFAVKLRNLTDDLNTVKQNQSSWFDLGIERDHKLDVISTYLLTNMTVWYLNDILMTLSKYLIAIL